MRSGSTLLLSVLLASLGLGACDRPVPGVAPSAAPMSHEARPEQAASCEPAPDAISELEALAFTSRERCEALVEAGRLLPRQEGTVRFGSWNIRFFPDGGPNGPHRPTDVEWLACAIAFMQVDVLAVQEFLAPVGDQAARIAARHRALIDRLNALTGGEFALVLDDCEPNRRDRQHVGLLYDARRVRLDRVRQISSMNPDGGCRSLRPGLAADVRAEGGLDLHVVSFHGKAYGDPRSRGRREHVYASMREIVREIREGSGETDLLILGDFNTVGCEGCAPVESAEAEVGALARAAETAGLVRVEASQACSHYWDRAGSFGALDHIVADASMRELEKSARVSGFCAATACAYHGGAAHAGLSDHCPLLIDLVDEDRDP